jgi:hypothetical protein
MTRGLFKLTFMLRSSYGLNNHKLLIYMTFNSISAALELFTTLQKRDLHHETTTSSVIGHQLGKQCQLGRP